MPIIMNVYFVDSGDNKSTFNAKQKSEITARVLLRSK